MILDFSTTFRFPCVMKRRAVVSWAALGEVLSTGEGEPFLLFSTAEVTAGLLSPDLDSPVQLRHGKVLDWGLQQKA